MSWLHLSPYLVHRENWPKGQFEHLMLVGEGFVQSRWLRTVPGQFEGLLHRVLGNLGVEHTIQ